MAKDLVKLNSAVVEHRRLSRTLSRADVAAIAKLSFPAVRNALAGELVTIRVAGSVAKALDFQPEAVVIVPDEAAKVAAVG